MRTPPISPSRRLLGQVLLGSAIVMANIIGAPAASARAAKDPAPSIKVEARICQVGATVEERALTATTSAQLRGPASDRVALRFTIQRRLTARGGWETLPAQSNTQPVTDPGPWKLGSAGRVGLRFTQTFLNLAEGVRYRMVVDARGLGTDGKVVTKTARRYVNCTQPLFTPEVRLTSASVTDTASGSYSLDAKLYNAGRLASGPSVVTVFDHATRRELGRLSIPAISGRKRLQVRLPLTECPQRLFVVVEDLLGADGAPASAAQVQTPTCPAPQ